MGGAGQGAAPGACVAPTSPKPPAVPHLGGGDGMRAGRGTAPAPRGGHGDTGIAEGGAGMWGCWDTGVRGRGDAEHGGARMRDGRTRGCGTQNTGMRDAEPQLRAAAFITPQTPPAQPPGFPPLPSTPPPGWQRGVGPSTAAAVAVGTATSGDNGEGRVALCGLTRDHEREHGHAGTRDAQPCKERTQAPARRMHTRTHTHTRVCTALAVPRPQRWRFTAPSHLAQQLLRGKLDAKNKLNGRKRSGHLGPGRVRAGAGI